MYGTDYLRKADEKDRAVLIKILSKAFVHDPHLRWVLKHSKPVNKIQYFMEYIVDDALERCDIYITKNNEGCSLWYNENNKNTPFNLSKVKRELNYFFRLGAIASKRGLETNKYTNSQLKKYPHFNYLHFLGILPEHHGKGLSKLLVQQVIQQKLKENKSIVLQTAVPKNILIYEKAGFSVVDRKSLDPSFDITFMEFVK